MSPKRPSRKSGTEPVPPISAADFPALSSFLRGYLHQDMKDEYGSPEAAARSFWSDADEQERASVAEQWTQFLNRTDEHPLSEVNRVLTVTLGSSYSLTAEDVLKLSAVFSSNLRHRPK
jgi:contact-dependent growth inhibition (CDI) system CdiI-like immunity protein